MTNPELEKDLMQYQNLERQLQNVLMQKQQLQIQSNEVALALDELGRTSETEVFKSIGAVMVKTTKEEATKDLDERKKMGELRLNSLTKQEEQLKGTLTDLKTKLEAVMKSQQTGAQ